MSTINNVSINNVLSIFTSGFQYDIIEDDSNGKNLISITDKTYLVSFENIKGRYRFGLVKLDLLEGSRGQSINLVYTKDGKLHLSDKSTGTNIYFKPSYKNPDILDSVVAYNKDNPSNQIDAIYCCDGSIIFVEKEEEMSNMSNNKQNNKVTNNQVLYKSTTEDRIDMIKRHKEEIVSIFEGSRILENAMSTIIDNLDEFVTIIDNTDVESFHNAMNKINVQLNFIARCVLAGKTNEEIFDIIDSINNEFDNDNTTSVRCTFRSKNNNTRESLGKLIDARRNSSNIEEYFTSMIDILKNDCDRESFIEDMNNMFSTRLGYIVESYIIDLVLDKKVVFAILLGTLNESSIEQLKADIINKKAHIRKIRYTEPEDCVKRQEAELECIESRLNDELAHKNKTLAKLFRYTQIIDTLK